MNRDDTIKAIAVMQAWLDGKVIEFYDAGRWVHIEEPAWAWNKGAYRIKPEPREWWISPVLDGGCTRYCMEIKPFNQDFIHVRAVLDDE